MCLKLRQLIIAIEPTHMLAHGAMSKLTFINANRLGSLMMLISLVGLSACSGRNIDEKRRDELAYGPSGWRTASYNLVSMKQINVSNRCNSMTCTMTFAITSEQGSETGDVSIQVWSDTLIIKGSAVYSTTLKSIAGTTAYSTSIETSETYKKIFFADEYLQAIQQALGLLPTPLRIELMTVDAQLSQDHSNTLISPGSHTKIRFHIAETQTSMSFFNFESKPTVVTEVKDDTHCEAWGYVKNESLSFRVASPKSYIDEADYEYLYCKYVITDEAGILSFYYFNTQTLETKELKFSLMDPK